MQTKIKEWAEKAVATYTDIALNPSNKSKYHVYTQSDLMQVVSNPKVMIVGINPGSGKEGHFNNPTVEDFLKGNPCWDERDKWNYWKNIKSLVGVIPEFVDDSLHTVVTNLTCFASKELSQLNQRAMRETAPLTMELIKILSPHILVIISRNVLSIIKHINKENGMLGNIYDEAVYDDVYVGSINGIPMVCIPHPNTRPTREKKRLCQESLRLTAMGFSAKQVRSECAMEIIPAIEKRKAQKTQDQNEIGQFATCVIERLREAGLSLYEENDKTKRFIFADDLQLTVTTCDKGYLAIRLKEHPAKFHYSSQDWKNKGNILSIMVDKYGWNQGEAWIATKHFSQLSSTDDAVKEILAIYNDLKEI